MLTQILVSAINSIVSKIISAYNGLGDAKFFVTIVLAFVLSLGYIYKDTVDLAVRSHTFATVKFRELRNTSGLEKDLSLIASKDSNIQEYGVYLYEPEDHAYYKRLVLTNSEQAKNIPALQSIYLKDQPSLNEMLKNNTYYLLDATEIHQHADLKYLTDLNMNTILFYKLSVNDVIVGEIVFRLKVRPTPEDLERLIRRISPLVYLYII